MPKFLNGKINAWSFHWLENDTDTEESKAERKGV